MTTSLASYRRAKNKSKSNNDICSIVNEINDNSDGNRNHNASNLRRISSDDLSDLAEIMDDANDIDEDADNFPNDVSGQNMAGVRKEHNNRRNIVR